jgi:hypothetical protein
VKQGNSRLFRVADVANYIDGMRVAA